MKLLQIALSLLLVLSPIACASLQTTTQDAVSNIKYGMEFSEVQKTLNAQGDVVLRWAEKGSNYFVISYNAKKTSRFYCMVFKDDIFTAFMEKSDFDEAFGKLTVPPVGKLPFEDGFEPLYSELVAQKYKPPHIDVNAVLFYSEASAAILTSILLYISLSGDIGSSFDDKKWLENFNNLSIGTSKGTVIKLLDRPRSSLKSIESDDEILFYIYQSFAIGLRAGKIEWIFKSYSSLGFPYHVGCAPHRYAVTMPLKSQLREYSILEIKDFENYVTGSEAEVVAKEIPYILLDAIAKHNESHPDRRLFSEATRLTSKSDGVLVVRGTLLNYDKGSRWKRDTRGWGAGKASCTVKCWFIDKSTGEHVLEATFEGVLCRGPFGGAAKGAYEKVVKEIVDCFNDNY